MGTHMAIAITKTDGTHKCIESPLDGYNIIRRWPEILLDTKEGDDPAIYGTSDSPEIGSEREHEQEFFIHINFRAKLIDFYGLPLDNSAIHLLLRFINEGWVFGSSDDCPQSENCW